MKTGKMLVVAMVAFGGTALEAAQCEGLTQ